MGFEPPTMYAGVYGSGGSGGDDGSPAPDAAYPNGTAFVHCFELDDQLHREAYSAGAVGTGERKASSGIVSDATYWTGSDQKVRSLALAIDKGPGFPAQWRECMVNRLTFKLAAGQVSFDADLIANRLTYVTSGQASWVRPPSQRMLFTQALLYLDVVGATLINQFGVQEFELTIDNGLTTDYETGAASAYCIEPNRGASRKITGRLKLARFALSNWHNWVVEGTQMQGKLNLVGPTIPGSSYPYLFAWVMPLMQITKASFPVAGPGVITGDIEFTLSKPASTQTWLTTLLGGMVQRKSNELLAILTNGRGCNFMRDRQYADALYTLPT
jgi:hypothetical protein